MYDDISRLFALDRYGDPEEPDWSRYDAAPSAERLWLLVYVDGRLVESRTEPVTGTRWEVHARRFDEERRPDCRHVAPPRPAHEQVLDWLCGLVGGPDTLDSLTDQSTPDPEAPTFDGPEDLDAYDAVAGHLDRVGRLFFDDEVNLVLARALATLWVRDPGVVRGPGPAQQTAGGLVWVVGRANGLFGGGLTQTTLQRELWLKTSLSTAGQRVARALRGVSLQHCHRPAEAPDLMAFADAALLTPTTQRTLIRWRDQARAAERPVVLPSEVEF